MGILAIVFGLLLLVSPAATSTWVAFLVGIWWLASGIMNLVSMFVDHSMWGWKLFAGILGIVAGVIVLDAVGDKPLLTTLGLASIYIFVLGIQGIIIGIIDIVKAFQGGGWGIGLIGVLSMLFGAFLMYNPFAGALALPFVFGILAIVLGAAAIFMAFRVRKA